MIWTIVPYFRMTSLPVETWSGIATFWHSFSTFENVSAWRMIYGVRYTHPPIYLTHWSTDCNFSWSPFFIVSPTTSGLLVSSCLPRRERKTRVVTHKRAVENYLSSIVELFLREFLCAARTEKKTGKRAVSEAGLSHYPWDNEAPSLLCRVQVQSSRRNQKTPTRCPS